MIFNWKPCAACGEFIGAIAPALPATLCLKCADLAALRERLAAAEALSESRRVTLLAKSEELAAEWKRAETAEALVRELAAVVKAAEAYRDRGWKASGRIDPFVKVRNAYDATVAALSPAARKEIER